MSTLHCEDTGPRGSCSSQVLCLTSLYSCNTALLCTLHAVCNSHPFLETQWFWSETEATVSYILWKSSWFHWFQRPRDLSPTCAPEVWGAAQWHLEFVLCGHFHDVTAWDARRKKNIFNLWLPQGGWRCSTGDWRCDEKWEQWDRPDQDVTAAVGGEVGSV